MTTYRSNIAKRLALALLLGVTSILAQQPAQKPSYAEQLAESNARRNAPKPKLNIPADTIESQNCVVPPTQLPKYCQEMFSFVSNYPTQTAANTLRGVAKDNVNSLRCYRKVITLCTTESNSVTHLAFVFRNMLDRNGPDAINLAIYQSKTIAAAAEAKK
jgi:hypothetical protein